MATIVVTAYILKLPTSVRRPTSYAEKITSQRGIINRQTPRIEIATSLKTQEQHLSQHAMQASTMLPF